MEEASAYQRLHKLIRDEDLLEKDPKSYIANFTLRASWYALTIWLVINYGNNLVYLAGISFLLAFTHVQFGLLGHDANHYQIFTSKRLNDLAAFLFWNMGLGLSNRWWQSQHNDHHTNPNHVEEDPSINMALVVFSQEQLRKRCNIEKWVIRYQAYFYFPLMAFSVIYLRLSGIGFLLKNRPKGYISELAGLAAHFILYYGLMVRLLTPADALFFALLHHIFAGLYIGMIFAPNHKGMPTIANDDPLINDRFRLQVITSRNIRGSRLVDFIYGGLNYQIEHHLFPSMPRKNLPKAKIIIESFCRDNRVSYHETGVWQSFKEITSYLQEQSRLKAL